MRVLVDTNLIFSSILFPGGVSAKAFSLCAESGWLAIPAYVEEELMDVVGRKCPSRLKDVQSFLERISYESLEDPWGETKDRVEMRDPEDIPILRVALLERVDVILTGDLDFKSLDLSYPKIMSPREFLEEFVEGYLGT